MKNVLCTRDRKKSKELVMLGALKKNVAESDLCGKEGGSMKENKI